MQTANNSRVELGGLGLNWKLAAQRVRKDIGDDFWPDPLRYADFLGHIDTSCERLDSALAAYEPERCVSSAIPKANLTIRDSIQLTILDRFVYQALADKLIESLDPLLASGVFSHRLRSPKHKVMFKSGVAQWKQFKRAIREYVSAEPTSFVVRTDVAQYFETIHFKVLRRQLSSLISEAGRPDL